MSRWSWVPAGLIGLRVGLGIVLLGCAANPGLKIWIFPALMTSMLSDIFDGVIARRLGIAVAPLRVADSRADAWFFLCVGISAWWIAPQVIRAFAIPLAIEVLLQSASYAFDLVKYGRIATFHAYTAKAWGFSLYLAAVGVLVFHSGTLLWLAFGVGLASVIDAFAIKLLLPKWQHDVLSCFHAIKVRRAQLTLS